MSVKECWERAKPIRGRMEARQEIAPLSPLSQLPIRTAARLGRLYCTHVPTTWAKFAVWQRLFRRRIAPRQIACTVTSSFGGRFRLELSDWIQCSIYAFGEWEPVITAYLHDRLRSGDIFIDVGANIGYHTILAGLKVGNTGVVHAIEASPRTFALLCANISRNDLTNIRYYNVAASDKPGELTLWIKENQNIGRSTVVKNEKEDYLDVEGVVRALPLTSIVPEEDILRARFIKIDVEGAEWLVLQGIMHLLPSLSRECEILLEVDPEALRSFGASTAACLTLLTDAGFVPWIIDRELNQPFHSPQKPGVGIRPLTNELNQFECSDLLFRRP